MRGHLSCVLLRAVCALLLISPHATIVAWAAEETEEPEAITLPEVTVKDRPIETYRRESRTAVTADVAALPAPSTILDAQYIRQTPYTGTYGDLLRQLPGMNVANYGQCGLGYGVSMRGFTNLEHGRDVAYFIDDIPVNQVSNIQTPNYADLNILIPETVERMEVIRGPFSAQYGDSNLGGSVNVVTKRFDDEGSVSGYGGSYNTNRGVVTYSRPRGEEGSISPFLVFTGYNQDGYRFNQGCKQYNLFGKFTVPTRHGDLSIRTQFYGVDGGSAGYIPRSLVQAGILSPKAAVNNTDGNDADFQNVTLNYVLGEVDQALTFTGFVNHDVQTRFADFGGGQNEAEEDRTTIGFTGRKVWTAPVMAVPAQLMVGTNFRSDSVDALQLPTVLRTPVGPPSLHMNYTEIEAGQYVQAQVKPLPWLKFTGGGRYDYIWYHVNNQLSAPSVPPSDAGVWSPKAGVAVSPVSWLEVYANYGQSFRSLRAIDELLTSPNAKPSKLRSEEVGIQIQLGRFRFLADGWYTKFDREVFQPAPTLPLQNLGHSLREGYDLEGQYVLKQDPQGKASLFVNFTQMRAVLLNEGPMEFVPNVPAYILNVGSDFDVPVCGVETPHRLFGLVYGSYYGRQNLTTDGTLTTSPYSRISGRLGYAHQTSGWSAYLDLIWYPGDRLSEVAVNLGPSVGATPSQIGVNPMAPFQIFLGLTYRFATGGKPAAIFQ